MWNSEKLLEVAVALKPVISDNSIKMKLQYAIDLYTMDKGEAILNVFLIYFKRDFIRQFWNGDESKITKAILKKLVQVNYI